MLERGEIDGGAAAQHGVAGGGAGTTQQIVRIEPEQVIARDGHWDVGLVEDELTPVAVIHDGVVRDEKA